MRVEDESPEQVGDAEAERLLGFEHHLKELSRGSDPFEKLAATVDFEMFQPILLRVLRRGRKRRGPGGRPPNDPVLKFKMLALQALHGLSLAQTSYLMRDRLS